ncbi:MAG: hypothetical protein K8H90_06675 [Thermoanaerobaculia bacterium]|nr:hypothetical protein [Thermoanaerobaculia bacterium]
MLIDLRFAYLTAIRAGLEYLASQGEAAPRLRRRSGWPMIGTALNGMPDFQFASLGSETGPLDYSSVFESPLLGAMLGQTTSGRSLPWFTAFRDACLENADVRTYFVGDEPDARQESSLFSILTSGILGGVLDAYIHSKGDFGFDEELAVRFFELWTRPVFEDRLPCRTVVPISFVTFEFDELELDDGVRISRIDARDHVARLTRPFGTFLSLTDNERAASLASHALYSEGWSIPRQKNILLLKAALSEQSEDQADFIGTFFASLRACFPHPLGYAQVLVEPIGWATRFEYTLQEFGVYSCGEYRQAVLGARSTAGDLPVCRTPDLDQLGAAFRELRASNQRGLKLASSRLNRAALRDHPDDALVDACIVLEALLSDGSTQEITHKLSMRLALVASRAIPSKAPGEIFREAKDIYSARSKLVHGARKGARDSASEEDAASLRTAAELSFEYARTCLLSLLVNPEFRDPVRLDEFLLQSVRQREA